MIEQSIAAARAYGYEKGLVYINNLFKPYLYDERLFNTNFLTEAPDVVRVESHVPNKVGNAAQPGCRKFVPDFIVVGSYDDLISVRIEVVKCCDLC